MSNIQAEGKIYEPYVRSGLAPEQREAVFLLSIGTFLEYFDLMLYIHMAVLLNELFFPQSDPLIAQLLATFTFCSTFILRPIGGFIIGRIGDNIGRKGTVIITTFIMAICCVVIANTPTYAEIGIAASAVIIVCRSLQGFTSMGEKVGAQLYLAEIMNSPYKYIYSWFVPILAELGATFALIVASFSISHGFNWRTAFWVGAFIAIIGLIARTRLRETPEFVSYKLRLKKQMEANKQNPKILENSSAYKEKIDNKTVLAYFFIRLMGPICFYITYIYMSSFMKESLRWSAEKIINQNLKVSILTVVGMLITMCFVKKIHPVKIAKINAILFIICLPCIPYCLNHVTDWIALAFLQCLFFFPSFSMSGVEVALFKHFPVAKRFTVLATTFGVSGALALTVVSFISAPLTNYFGYYGLWFIYIPVVTSFLYSINYIQKLEQKKGSYDNYPNEDNLENPDTALNERDYNYDLNDKKEYAGHNLSCEYAENLLNRIQSEMAIQKKPINVKLIEKAIIFAKKWHDGQFRDNGDPYYSHPLAVAYIVAEHYLKTDVIIAAILHDVVEDSDCTVELIEAEFNSRIAQLVNRLTKFQLNENGVQIKMTLEQTIGMLNEVGDNEALFIKQLDRSHNMETIGNRSQEKQIKTAVETNNILTPEVSYTADKLNIVNSVSLENKLFKFCKNIIWKAEQN